MSESIRLCALALFAVGPAVAVMSLLRRRFAPAATLHRVEGWRWYVPPLLLPVEWILPPLLIAFGVGEIDDGWLPLRVVALFVGVVGAVLLVWSSVVLGRFLVHEASVQEGHALVASGPYRFVRHPIYTGYLALLLGCGVATLNLWLLLLWPLSLTGILIQSVSEERLLRTRFGEEYECYSGRTGRFLPRFGRLAKQSSDD